GFVFRMSQQQTHGGSWDVTLPPPRPKKTEPFDKKTVRDFHREAVRRGRDEGIGYYSDAAIAEREARRKAEKKAKKREAKKRKRRWGAGGMSVVGSYSKSSSGQKFRR